MSLNHLRCGARIAAAAFDTAALGAGLYFAVSARQLQVSDLIQGLILVAIVSGTWLLVEAVVGGFEQLQRYQSSSEAIVARTITMLSDDRPDAEVVSIRR